jgi:mono/diheme cytochrome c family protein
MRINLLAATIILFAGMAAAQDTAAQSIVIPVPDAKSGRVLFTSKGCVICHSVNGVGGKAGPALDAPAEGALIDPLAFAARMWRGAEAMTILQSTELGYQIELTGAEIADLAAFAASLSEQGTFSESDIPELIRGWTMDEPFPPDGGEWPAQPDVDALDETVNVNAADIAYGQSLAEASCMGCHVIAPDSAGGVAGPAFATVAARPGVTEDMIESWLSVPHEKMPEFLRFEEAELQALGAYIMSLAP